MIREMLRDCRGILQDLHNDHNEVATLFERIGDSENGAERSALFKEMSTKLLAHAKAEQEVLYRRMENSPNEESRRFALEGTSEHGLIEQQVQKLSGMSDPMSDAWAAELKVLEDLIDPSRRRGGRYRLQLCARRFETEEREAMRDEFQRRKRQLLSAVENC